MAKLARAIVTPISIIDKGAAKIVLEVVAVAATLTGHPEIAFLAALALATLYGPTPPKPPTTEGALKTSLPPRISAYGRCRLFGAYILFDTAENGTAVDAFGVHDGRADAIEGQYIGDKTVALIGSVVQKGDDGRYKNSAVHLYYTMGEAIGPGIPALEALLPADVWGPTYRGDGVVLLATTWKPVKAKVFSETYPQGQPEPASLVGRWQLVFDWRDEAQSVDDPDTWAWSENPVLHTAHYHLVRMKAVREPGEVLPAGAALLAAWERYFLPTLDFWTAAADDCDVAMALKAGGTEPRYRSCVAHKHTDPHKDVIAALLATFDGWVAPRADGALVVYSGRYYAPTVDIGSDEIVSYTWERGVRDEDIINEIPLSYVSAAHDFTTVDATAWVDLDDVGRRGAIRSEPLELQIPSHAQARRLAKRMLARAMAPARGTVTTNSAGRVVRGQRFVNLHIEEAGAVFYDGPVEITQLVRNFTTGGVTFSWASVDPNIDAWNPATEEGEPATVGTRVAGAPLEAPEITLAVFTGGTPEGFRVHITVTGPDADREDITWYARWRRVGDASWNEQTYSDIDAGPAVVLETMFVPGDSEIEVEAAYQVGDGRISDWSDPVTVTDDTGGTADTTIVTSDTTLLTADRG